MAVTREEYEFIARFKTEALEAARQANEALEAMGDAGDEAAQGAREAAAAVQELKTAAAEVVGALAATYAALRPVLAGIQQFAQLETQMVGVAKTADLTDREIDKLSQRFMGLAAVMGVPIEQLTEAGQTAGQLGVKGVDNIALFAETIVKLGGASNLAGEEAATALARLLNVTGESIENVDVLASQIVGLGNNVAATEKEIAHFATTIAQSTAAFGGDTTFATGMGAAFAELGLRAELAGTAVGRFMTEMTMHAAQGSEGAERIAGVMGLTMSEFQAFMESDTPGAYIAFLEGLSTMDNAEMLIFLDDLKLANAESLRAITPIVENLDKVKDRLRLSSEEYERNTALVNENARAQDTLERDLVGLNEAWKAASTELGETFAPIYREVVQTTRDAVIAFNELDPAVKQAIHVVGTLVPLLVSARLAMSAIARVIGVLRLAGLATGLTGVAAGAGAAATAMGALRAALALIGGPLGLAITALSAAVILIPDTQDKIEDLDEASNAASEAMKRFAEASQQAEEDQGRLGGQIAATTAQMLQQTRVDMQEQLRELKAARDEVLGEVDGRDLGRVISGISFSMQNGGPSGRGNAFVDEMLESLRRFRQGQADVDAVTSAYDRFAQVGEEAMDVVENFDRAMGDNNISIKDASDAVVRYARDVGIFGKELRELDRFDPQSAEWFMAFPKLRDRILEAHEAGEIVRQNVPEAFIAAAREAADASVQVRALEAALQGNLDLAYEILNIENPFKVIEDGAEDAASEVKTLLKDIEAVLGIDFSKGGSFANMKAEDFEHYYTAGAGASQDHNELVRQTIRLAERMDMSAQDLLAIFSYETGGTLNPWQAGPTTQWGQHRGLIQWGEPQAEQYGVTGSSTIAEQMAAVERYLRDKGIQNGDSVLRVYAAINAGDPDALGASDAHNGGAPGTVAEKVRDQFGPHQARAQGLLAGYSGTVATTKEQIDAEIAAQKEYVKTLEERLEAAEEFDNTKRQFLETNRQTLEDLEFEATLFGKSAREQARLRAEYEMLTEAKRAGIDVDKTLTDTGRTYREVIEEQAQAIADQTAAQEQLRIAQENATERQEFYNQQQEAFKNGVLDAILEGENLIDTLGGIAKAFARAALEAALFGDGPFGGGTGLLSGLVGALFPGAGTSATVTSAKGNVFYQSALVPLAYGGTGLIGEAGPEAAMPLKRMADGTLGVYAEGAAGMGGMNLHYAPTFNINIAEGRASVESDGASAPGAYDDMLKQLDKEVQAKVLEVLMDQQRSGGLLNPAVKPYG